MVCLCVLKDDSTFKQKEAEMGSVGHSCIRDDLNRRWRDEESQLLRLFP